MADKMSKQNSLGRIELFVQCNIVWRNMCYLTILIFIAMGIFYKADATFMWYQTNPTERLLLTIEYQYYFLL